jgi:uncharacterized membrane protein
MFISLLAVSYATDYNFILYDTNSNPVSGSFVTANYDDILYETITKDNALKLSIDDLYSNVIITVDDLSTPAVDYYNSINLNYDTLTQAVYLHRVGTVKINVVDADNNFVSNASLFFECDKTQADLPINVNAFGSVVISNFKENTCKVYAGSYKLIGVSNFTISKGDSKEVNILIQKKSKDYSVIILQTLLNLIFLAIAGYMIFANSNKSNSFSRNENIKNNILTKNNVTNSTITNNAANKNDELLLQSFDNSEKELFLYLKEKKLSSQARIVNELRIPRTTVSRILSDFEKKKFVTISIHGKLKEVKFIL